MSVNIRFQLAVLFLLLVLASPLAVHGASSLVLEPGGLTTSSQLATQTMGGSISGVTVTITLTISGSNLIAEAVADTSNPGVTGWNTIVSDSLDQVFNFQISGVVKPNSAYTSSDHMFVLHSEQWSGPDFGSGATLCAREGGVNPWAGGANSPGYEEVDLVNFGLPGFDCGGTLGSLGITYTAVSGDVKYTIPVADPRIDTDGDSEVRIFSPQPFGYDFTSLSVKYVTPASFGTTSFNGQSVSFSTTGGALQGLTAMSDLSVPQTGRPPGLTMPYGLFSFKIVVPSAGASASVTVTFPSTLPAGTQWWKVHGGVWQQLPSSQVSQSGNQLTITLTDGATPDDSDSVAGQITDPGGPFLQAATTTTTATTAATATPFMPVHDAPVGGVMLPSVGFTLLVPWALVLSLLGFVSVEAFIVKHRTKRR